MSRFTTPSLLVLFLSLSTLLHANPRERAATIAPYVDEQTIAVVYVSVDGIDVSDAFKQVAELIPNLRARNQIKENATRSQAAIAVLKEADAELFVVVSTSDLPTPGPYIIVSAKQGADTEAILKAFKQQKPEACEQVDDVIFSGSAAALERIKNGSPVARPQFAQAFVAADDAPVQLVITPTTDHRRVIKEMLPQLPEALGGGSSRAIAELDWLAAGITFQPELQVNVTTQSPSEDSALALKSTIGSLFFSLASDEKVRKSVPKIDKLLNSVAPRTEGKRLKFSLNADDGNVQQLLAALSSPVKQAQASAHRIQCVNNLKQLALGMHNYHSEHKSFPSAASHDAEGKPLLSWRVHLLPYLDEKELYKKFRLSEPWDSEHNKQLISKIPQVLTCPSVELSATGKTTYLVPTGSDGIFDVAKGTRIRDITDGTSNTIMIVDASPDRAVLWTKPQDIEIDPKKPLDGLGGQHEKTISAAFCDGSVHQLPNDIALKTLRWLLNPKDGNPIPRF